MSTATTLEGRPITGPIKPMSNFVLVKVREAAAQTLGGVVLPDQAKEKPTEGIVMEVGPGRLHPETNVLIDPCVENGQSVLYGKFDGSKVGPEMAVQARLTPTHTGVPCLHVTRLTTTKRSTHLSATMTSF